MTDKAHGQSLSEEQMMMEVPPGFAVLSNPTSLGNEF